MKSSTRYYRHAKAALFQSSILLVVLIVMGTKVAAAGLSDSVFSVMAAAITLVLLAERALEFFRLYRIASEEECREFRAAIRPRL